MNPLFPFRTLLCTLQLQLVHSFSQCRPENILDVSWVSVYREFWDTYPSNLTLMSSYWHLGDKALFISFLKSCCTDIWATWVWLDNSDMDFLACNHCCTCKLQLWILVVTKCSFRSQSMSNSSWKVTTFSPDLCGNKLWRVWNWCACLKCSNVSTNNIGGIVPSQLPPSIQNL
jgi:hypothetical protein